MNYYFLRKCASALFLLVIVIDSIVVADEEKFEELENLLEKAANNGELINGAIKLDAPKKVGKLGKGAQGIVWKGTLYEKRKNVEFKRRVAVKFSIQSGCAKNEQKNFHKLYAVNNETVEKKNIVVVYYEGEFKNKFPMIAMTLCDESLKDRIKKYKYFLPENILRMTYQLFRGVEYIHSKNIIHGDLNVGNIMFRGDQIFIIDFDCAREADFNKLRFFLRDMTSLYLRMLDSVTTITYQRAQDRDQAKKVPNEVAKEVFLYLYDQATVFLNPGTNSDGVDKNIKKQNYGILLNKILDGIKKLTGTEDLAIDWEMENAIRNLAPTKGLSTVKNMIEMNFKQNYWNGSLSEFERTIKIDQGGIVDAKKDGKLWTDQFGIYWKGLHKSSGSVPLLKRKKTEVTIKFEPEKMWIDRVYRMHRLMNAVNNKEIVKNGIPNVFHYSHDSIAFTFFHERILDKIAKEGGQISPENLLRTLYQGIFALKAIHGKGVIHQNLQPDNFVLYESRLLLTGFEYAEVNGIRYSNTFGGNELFGSISFTLGIIRSFMDDLKSLYYIILYIAGITLPWDGKTNPAEIVKDKINFDNVLSIRSKIKNPHVEEVFKQFYEKVFVPYKIKTDPKPTDYDSRLPPYNELGNLTLEGIKKITKSTADPQFYWPSDKGKSLGKFQLPQIESVKGPSEEKILFASQVMRP